MIEFDGYLTGAAEKGYIRKSRKQFLIGCCVLIPLAMPIVLFGGQFFKVMSGGEIWPTFALSGILLTTPLFAFIPQGKKEHKALLPKRVFIQDDCIVSVSDRQTVSQFIGDVKSVVDHGEFYELFFPFGKVSNMFICQKSLLTKGSLGQFERLFKDKLTKKIGGSCVDPTENQ